MVCVISCVPIRNQASRDPRVSSGPYGILATMLERFVDVLMSMGLKGLFRNSGSNFTSVVFRLCG